MAAIENEKIYGLKIRESANDGSDFGSPDADYQFAYLGEDFNLHVKDASAVVRHFGGVNATAMPASPGTLNRVYRSDLGESYIFDGTLWLCTGNHTLFFTPDGALPISSAQSARVGQPILYTGITDIWLTYFQVWFLVNSGGTALSASHKWVGTLAKQPAATTLSTVTIDSGSVATHRQSTFATIGALLGSTQLELDLTWAKTGTPGTLWYNAQLMYAHVAT